MQGNQNQSNSGNHHKKIEAKLSYIILTIDKIKKVIASRKTANTIQNATNNENNEESRERNRRQRYAKWCEPIVIVNIFLALFTGWICYIATRQRTEQSEQFSLQNMPIIYITAVKDSVSQDSLSHFVKVIYTNLGKTAASISGICGKNSAENGFDLKMLQYAPQDYEIMQRKYFPPNGIDSFSIRDTAPFRYLTPSLELEVREPDNRLRFVHGRIYYTDKITPQKKVFMFCIHRFKYGGKWEETQFGNEIDIVEMKNGEESFTKYY